MGQAELLIAGLLIAVAGLSVLARRLSVPYPIMLVVGGALFGFIPGLPQVKLDPQVVLVVFLPPLVYGAAIYANFNDFRTSLRPLALSTVALVLAAMGMVAWAAHALIPGLPPSSSGRSSRKALQRGDEPDRARTRPRGIAAGDMRRGGDRRRQLVRQRNQVEDQALRGQVPQVVVRVDHRPSCRSASASRETTPWPNSTSQAWRVNPDLALLTSSARAARSGVTGSAVRPGAAERPAAPHR
jgi:hypothetical protein